jgi:hypothetical protein
LSYAQIASDNALHPTNVFLIMDEVFEPQEMIDRFKLRAEAVKARQIPPVEGQERRLFVEQARLDYFDFSIIADGEATLEDGVLTIRVDLRPKQES